MPEYILDGEGSVSNARDRQLRSLFDTAATSTVSFNSTVQLTVRDTQVRVAWLGSDEFIPYYFCVAELCDVEFLVLNAEDDVKRAAFYPARDNLIIFSSDDTIGAIELDRNGTQNFQPLYIGAEPDFAFDPSDESSVYIFDAGNLIRLFL